MIICAEIQASDSTLLSGSIRMAADASGFEDIHREYEGKIRRYLERLVNPDDAEDLTQEVFIKVNRSLDGFKGESSLSTWIYRIATNSALDQMRGKAFKQDRQTVSLSAPVDPEDVDHGDTDLPDRGLSIERQAIRDEMSDCVRSFIDQLPEDYRTVIALSELQDLKNQEIADILEVSLGTVKIRLHRARKKLKEMLSTGCSFYLDERSVLSCDRRPQSCDEA